jgi:hypothetical protein
VKREQLLNIAAGAHVSAKVLSDIAVNQVTHSDDRLRLRPEGVSRVSAASREPLDP